jgi:hypothetical protein
VRQEATRRAEAAEQRRLKAEREEAELRRRRLEAGFAQVRWCESSAGPEVAVIMRRTGNYKACACDGCVFQLSLNLHAGVLWNVI